MSDENNKIIEQNPDTANEQGMNAKVSAVNINTTDVSKVKIRDILKQRFKKMRPSLKKALPLILVGIICFAAGVGVDRAFIGRRFGGNLRNRPGFNQSMPNNRFNNRQGNMKNNQNMPKIPNGKTQ